MRRRPFDALLAALPIALAATFSRTRGALPARVERDRAAAPRRRNRAGRRVWAAGLGTGLIVDRLIPARADPRSRPLVALLVIALAAVLPDRGAHPPTLSVWPAREEWLTLDEVTRRHQLDRL